MGKTHLSCGLETDYPNHRIAEPFRRLRFRQNPHTGPLGMTLLADVLGGTATGLLTAKLVEGAELLLQPRALDVIIARRRTSASSTPHSLSCSY
jgi:hypothetical protein